MGAKHQKQIGLLNPPECVPKSILENIKFLIDVGIDFWPMFDANLAPACPQLEAQDGPKSGVAPRKRFGRRSFILTPWWTVLASILKVLGSMLGGFGMTCFTILDDLGDLFVELHQLVPPNGKT